MTALKVQNVQFRGGKRRFGVLCIRKERTMDQKTIILVQSTWEHVVARVPQAAALFYHHLFAADPSLLPLFTGPLEEQGKKLMQMLDVAVGTLNDLETLVLMLQRLAKRHVAYGVKEVHYHTAGAALLKTLAEALGEAFTPAVSEAWAEVYGVMAAIMIAAATS